ncbi:hypothetical protein StoSoilA2_06140 [Arthrobacter sp. StoSoilA2]|uniref:hypothetical protein n=1 Tax=Arthrobacter sp. StoSoilA2 TaxID=2830990 RepID=UPI001CC4AEC9|nr:hypothetical protein [Arthrobacter sp. StoSoilA2]BCW34558.1 hypothetical protein StoSoilA2_06140 [Arthrobacter sp. StoSoilA2]
MARVPEPPDDPGPARSESEYEVIGGGVIDDRFPRRDGTAGSEHRLDHQPGIADILGAAVREAWDDCRMSLQSWWFWLACASGLLLAWATAAAVVAFGEANGWFESSLPSATYILMAGLMAVVSAVLGAVWGFHQKARTFLGGLFAGVFRGAVFAVPSGILLLTVGTAVGGPIALAGAGVVVVVLEIVLFGLIGAGARACSGRTAAGVALAAALVAFLCLGNVAATIALIPWTTVMDQASVPVNVERDDTGRITAYECVGRLRPVEVAHTERVAWLAASNPILLFGSVAAEALPKEHELAWVLSGLQWAADGPGRDFPCIGGESSDQLAPSVPVALTGLVIQAVVAALVLLPGRWLSTRRLTSARSGGPQTPGQA